MMGFACKSALQLPPPLTLAEGRWEGLSSSSGAEEREVVEKKKETSDIAQQLNPLSNCSRRRALTAQSQLDPFVCVWGGGDAGITELLRPRAEIKSW